MFLYVYSLCFLIFLGAGITSRKFQGEEGIVYIDSEFDGNKTQKTQNEFKNDPSSTTMTNFNRTVADKNGDN